MHSLLEVGDHVADDIAHAARLILASHGEPLA
jgi:hypothetical protein